MKEVLAFAPARATRNALLQALSWLVVAIEAVDHDPRCVARRRACPRVAASPKMYPSRTRAVVAVVEEVRRGVRGQEVSPARWGCRSRALDYRPCQTERSVLRRRCRTAPLSHQAPSQRELRPSGRSCGSRRDHVRVPRSACPQRRLRSTRARRTLGPPGLAPVESGVGVPSGVQAALPARS
jgi:hypothetical protein